MAPPVEAKTTCAPAARAASSVLTVPSTLTCASNAGRCIDVPTSACAARWRTRSASISYGSRMSCSTSRARASTNSRRPVERSSTTVTSSPRATSASTTCEPMKPAPPVTTARTGAYPSQPMFVTFEGLDGSGKTTQLELLRARLEADGHEVVAVREPGGTELGEAIRRVVLEGPDMAPWPEAALFAAARSQLVAEVIGPALERGADVLCDRYVDSSLAYQGIARGLGLHDVYELNM